MKRFVFLLIIVAATVAAWAAKPYISVGINAVSLRVNDKQTVAGRVKEFGGVVAKRWEPHFTKAGVPYPPVAVAILAFKQERRLEIHAAGRNGAHRFIRSYPILAASGRLGPKLRQGDRQVPEGLYRIELLNPNSLYHLSLRVNYPNEFDRQQAQRDDRKNLGGDIMIHGNAVSIGCIAIGDPAAEDLFVLVALTGVKNVRVIISPVDFRVCDLPSLPPGTPKWVETLYPAIKRELAEYPAPK